MKPRGLALIGTLPALLAVSHPAAGVQSQAELSRIADTAGALDNSARMPGPAAPEKNASCDGEVEYCPSAIQSRVDRSFSSVPIDSALAAARGGLTEIVERGCDQSNECEWRDRSGVGHFAWGDGEADLYIVIKTIEAETFAGRSIPALGIGTARKQADVIANVRRFLGDVEVDCDPAHVSGNVGPVECGATLNPGWIQIGFDHDDNLLRVRFDGYQFI